MEKFPIPENRFMREGVQVSPERRVLSVQFGDGYEQTADDGINTDTSSYTVTWTDVPKDTGDTIYAFLDRHLKHPPFLFTLPTTREQITVRCTALGKSLYNLTGTYKSITATLKRTATLGE